MSVKLPSQTGTTVKTESIRIIDEHVDDVFYIEYENITPLLQIDMVKGSNNMSKTKRMYKLFDEVPYPIEVPIFSSNGMRGLLRRLALMSIVEIGQKCDSLYKPNLSPNDLNFYASGDDSTVLSLNLLKYNEIERLREIMPNLSLFGAGLSLIEGKLAVSELSPRADQLFYEDKNGEYKTKELIASISGIRFDETKRITPLTPLIDEEGVAEWVEFLKENAKTKKQKKEKIDKIYEKIKKEKEKKEPDTVKINKLFTELEEVKNATKDKQTIMPHAKEYVVPNVKFEGTIWAKRGFHLNEIEMGMLFKILAKLSLEQLGSSKKDGFGIGKWTVTNSKYGSFENEINEKYLLSKRAVSYDEKILILIDKFDKWVETNRVWEYLTVEKLIQKAKETKSDSLFE